jgi:DNA modification methylase
MKMTMAKNTKASRSSKKAEVTDVTKETQAKSKKNVATSKTLAIKKRNGGSPTARKVLKAFNDLSPREWTMLSRNIWDDVSSPRNKRHLEHGAVYPVKLAERAITMYSGKGDLVFDPFNGIGSTLVAAAKLGRAGLGIELNPRFVQLTNEWLAEEENLFNPNIQEVSVVNDDCRNMEKYLMPNSVQLTVTSPHMQILFNDL